MKAIVSVDLNWGIGYKGNLLQKIPEDMKNFKQITLGKVVVMGRETFESLPGKEPLKERINIVLSRNERFQNEKVIICRSFGELFHELEKYDSEDVYLIGGESIYSRLLPCCSEAIITKIDKEYTADKYFINLDNEKSWELVNSSGFKYYNDIRFSFNRYVNHQKAACQIEGLFYKHI